MLDIKNTVAKNLQDARIAAGFTQGRLAMEAGMHKNTIHIYETGVNMSIDKLLQICNVLQIDFLDLFNEK